MSCSEEIGELFRAILVTSFLFFLYSDSISVTGSVIYGINKYFFSESHIHKANFLYFSDKKQSNSFLSLFLFNILG